ncbi:hypothetical protein MYX84_03900 [Acidobacteria bacterium AH-259-O06]|nr:hypothetical protein [Acidobacteria bacterium AH-259-O06]
MTAEEISTRRIENCHPPRTLALPKAFESYLLHLDGQLLRSRVFHQVLRYLSAEDEENKILSSLPRQFDENEQARHIPELLEPVDTSQYELRKMQEAIQQDVKIFSKIRQMVQKIGIDQDTKLSRLRKILSGGLKGKKVLNQALDVAEAERICLSTILPTMAPNSSAAAGQ